MKNLRILLLADHLIDLGRRFLVVKVFLFQKLPLKELISVASSLVLLPKDLLKDVQYCSKVSYQSRLISLERRISS